MNRNNLSNQTSYSHNKRYKFSNVTLHRYNSLNNIFINKWTKLWLRWIIRIKLFVNWKKSCNISINCRPKMTSFINGIKLRWRRMMTWTKSVNSSIKSVLNWMISLYMYRPKLSTNQMKNYWTNSKSTKSG